jgi:hypothetical protein
MVPQRLVDVLGGRGLPAEGIHVLDGWNAGGRSCPLVAAFDPGSALQVHGEAHHTGILPDGIVAEEAVDGLGG